MTTAHTAVTRVTDHFLEVAAKDRSAIWLANQLISEGYTITSIQTDTRFEPVVWVQVDSRLTEAVLRDEACYYRQGRDKHGHYRIGQLKRDGAIVQWTERPGRTIWWPTGATARTTTDTDRRH